MKKLPSELSPLFMAATIFPPKRVKAKAGIQPVSNGAVGATALVTKWREVF